MLSRSSMAARRNAVIQSGTPKHPVVRTLRWIAVVVLATWLLWMLVPWGV